MNTTKQQQESSVDYLMAKLQASKNKEAFLLDFWFYWVESVTLTDKEFQKVCANGAVNRWFMMELAKEENEYRAIIAQYQEVKGRQRDWLYIKCVNKLMSRFPQALLQQAKKRELKPQTTKVAGMKIEFKIFNQN
jgi:hypothetical protein